MSFIINSSIILVQLFLRLNNNDNNRLEDAFDNNVCIVIYPIIAALSYIELYNLEDRIESYTPMSESLIKFMVIRFSMHVFLCRKFEFVMHHLTSILGLFYIYQTRRFHYYAILIFMMETTQLPLILYYKYKKVFLGVLFWIFFILFRLFIAFKEVKYHFEDVGKMSTLENIISKIVLLSMCLLNTYWFVKITIKFKNALLY